MKVFFSPPILLALLVTLASSEVAMSETPSTGPVLAPPDLSPKIRLGNEVLFDDPQYQRLIQGKRVGLITNPTGIDSRFIHTIDKLAGASGTRLTALFAPEHGLRGAETAGESVKSGVDPVTGVPVYSLHGTDEKGDPLRKPTAEMLKDVDVLIYDMQDIGNRSYTYVGTMEKCMEAARENKIPFLVLDRPNPMGGEFVDGNILDPAFQSLVGWAPVPYLYGMTPGEMARWMNENSTMSLEHETVLLGAELTVVPMQGWKRSMKWWDTGLPWIPTSTHMQKPEVCWHIAATGTFGELHSINEGVGYPAPFEYIGAPWISSEKLTKELNSRNLPGYYFRPAHYKPYYGTYKGEQCSGAQVVILDYNKVRPVEAGVHILEAIHKLYPTADVLHANTKEKKRLDRVKMFNKVTGTDQVRNQILAGMSAAEIVASWKPEREKWVETSRKYLIYD